MGITLSGVQNLLDLWKLGYLDNKKSVIEFGSQELHLKEADLLDLISKFGFTKEGIALEKMQDKIDGEINRRGPVSRHHIRRGSAYP